MILFLDLDLVAINSNETYVTLEWLRCDKASEMICTCLTFNSNKIKLIREFKSTVIDWDGNVRMKSGSPNE